jgi:hypothetical protein
VDYGYFSMPATEKGGTGGDKLWADFWSGSRAPAKPHFSDPIQAAGGGSASVAALNAVEKTFDPRADVTR